MRGFSLVEILVVIAIAGLIAAMSVPAYKAYVIKTKVAAALPLADKFIKESIIYYERNGVFPTITELGYPTEINEYRLANPDTYLDSVIRIAVFSECSGQKANVNIGFNTTQLGLNGNMNFMYRLRPPGSAGENIYEVACFYHANASVHSPENTNYLPDSCQNEWVFGCF